MERMENEKVNLTVSYLYCGIGDWFVLNFNCFINFKKAFNFLHMMLLHTWKMSDRFLKYKCIYFSYLL